MSNRLANETSPYLLQHAQNPVDWRPWGEEAFADAKASGKPIFLSIGYSTCHWCHVMERESFEDAEVAAILNDRYIPVKVDREERPDVDQVYMRVCQALNGSGGWPLTVIMTPGGEPFFAATYIPKEPRGQRPGLMQILPHLSILWETEREKVLQAADKLSQAMRISAADYPPGEENAFDPIIFSKAAAELSQRFDAEWGGFGGAPKFPSPHAVGFLLRRHRRSESAHMLSMCQTTLDAMRAGGLWDHAGFGFHRYSTDKFWRVPHFEKMLYDQAGLGIAFTEAHQQTGREDYAGVASQILDYVAGRLSAPGGGFYCGEDADSEGSEGRSYLWTKAEILDLLGEADGAEFCAAFGVTDEGNYTEEATGAATGLNILHSPKIAEWSAAAERHAKALSTLLLARDKRIQPSTDTKVLAGWTSFMASAFLRAGPALGNDENTARGLRALEYVREKLWSGERLLRAERKGLSELEGFCEDYAFFARACIDAHRATLDAKWLKLAEEVAETLITRFSNDEGGLYDSSHDSEKLLFRPRESTDGAYPSGASIALEVFARLGLATGEEKWTRRAQAALASEAGLVARFPSAFTQLLCGASLVAENPRTLTLYGDPAAPAFKALHAAALKVFAPETEIRRGEEPVPAPKAVLCDRQACLYDVTEPLELAALLRAATK